MVRPVSNLLDLPEGADIGKGIDNAMKAIEADNDDLKDVLPRVPILVWVDVDEGIADVVRYLNTIRGVRTYASCQGTIGEGGPEPYGPQVMIREPVRKKEQEKRRTVGKLSPWS